MKVHVQTKQQHFAIGEIACPECKAAKSHNCIAQERPFTRFPSNIVHAIRVKAMGHNVRCI